MSAFLDLLDGVLSADVVCSARGFMFSLGCIQALQCNENTCHTRIIAHDPELQKGLDLAVTADRVANYAISMREEVELIAHSCGVLNPQALSRQHAHVKDDQGQPSPLNTKRNCHREARPLITTAATDVTARLTV